MQSIRRVALRSVATAARAAAPKAPTSQFAGQFVAKNAVKPAAVSFARYFSQSVRRMEENGNNDIEAQLTEQAPGSTETSHKQQSADPPHGVWVRNFVFDVNEDHLKEMFSTFGTVVDARIVRDVRGLSRGFGFVYMSSDAEVEAAVAELNGSFWHGRRVYLAPQTGERRKRARENAPTGPTKYLYIGNIPYEATDAELNKMFRGLENLEDVRVAVDRVTGFPRGFAHADFTDAEAAAKAYEKLSGFELNGRPLRIDYAGNDFAGKPDRKSQGGRGRRERERERE